MKSRRSSTPPQVKDLRLSSGTRSNFLAMGANPFFRHQGPRFRGRQDAESSLLTKPAFSDPRVEKSDGAETYAETGRDRKSTRLNSSHSQISYAVFCLKK